MRTLIRLILCRLGFHDMSQWIPYPRFRYNGFKFCLRPDCNKRKEWIEKAVDGRVLDG